MTPQASGAGAFRAVLDSIFAQPAYRWAEEPALLRLLREWWQWLADWLQALRADNPLVFRVLALGLVVALLLIFAHAGWVVWRTVRSAAGPGEGPAPGPRERRDAGWYSQAADRAAGEGRLAEALQLAFISLALTLQSQGLLQYHPSKTPAECARDARLVPGDRERLRELVGSLYVYAFGGAPVGPDDYRRWRETGAGPWHAPAH